MMQAIETSSNYKQFSSRWLSLAHSGALTDSFSLLAARVMVTCISRIKFKRGYTTSVRSTMGSPLTGTASTTDQSFGMNRSGSTLALPIPDLRIVPIGGHSFHRYCSG